MGTKAQEAPWLAEGEEKRVVVRELFADLAPKYDFLNDVLSFGTHRRWRAAAVRSVVVKEGDSALDVCTGTGDLLRLLVREVGREGRAVGLDFCPEMLARARRKAAGAELTLGDACRLPVGDGVFDAVTVGWGLRNVSDISVALGEAVRVLKPGGRFVTLDMARPRSRLFGRLCESAFKTLVPLIGRAFGKARAYKYLPESTLLFLTREEMRAAMERAGLRDVRSRDFFFGNVCMHWGVKP